MSNENHTYAPGGNPRRISATVGQTVASTGSVAPGATLVASTKPGGSSLGGGDDTFTDADAATETYDVKGRYVIDVTWDHLPSARIEVLVWPASVVDDDRLKYTRAYRLSTTVTDTAPYLRPIARRQQLLDTVAAHVSDAAAANLATLTDFELLDPASLGFASGVTLSSLGFDD